MVGVIEGVGVSSDLMVEIVLKVGSESRVGSSSIEFGINNNNNNINSRIILEEELEVVVVVEEVVGLHRRRCSFTSRPA